MKDKSKKKRLLIFKKSSFKASYKAYQRALNKRINQIVAKKDIEADLF